MGLKIKKKGTLPAWAKRGKSADEEVKREQARADSRSARSFPFRMKQGEEATITFLDGDLLDTPEEKGLLNYFQYKQHTVDMGTGNREEWTDFVCLADVEPCPICESGEHATVVGALTVIDHRDIKAKRSGKSFKDSRRLFIMKRRSLAVLQKHATKHGGLTGWTVDISRSEEQNSPKIGDFFDFTEQNTLAALAKAYPKTKATEATDYAETVGFLPVEELVKLGFQGVGPAIGDIPADDDIPF